MPVGLLLALVLSGAGSGMRPDGLRCEYRSNPLGIDVRKPRLSWTLTASGRGAMQTAYQVLVAESEAALKAHHGTLWDSGKVNTDQSAQVVYAGSPLHSGERAWWSVKVWDQSGRASAWSAPSRWEMGLLAPQDWSARWIGAPPPGGARADTMQDAKWIWYPEGNPAQSAPEGDRYFRLTLTVPTDKPVQTATLAAVVDNSFTAAVNGQAVGSGSGWQTLQTMEVGKQLHPGANAITIVAHNTDGPAGLAARLTIRYQDGATHRYVTGPTWKAAQEPAPNWQAPTYDDAAWKPAMVIANIGEGPWGMIGEAATPAPVPYLRKTFSLAKPIRQARLYASALGLYRLSVNGRPVSQDRFTPGWTDYRKRIQYQTYDVTGALKRGENALGIVLGDGWYCGYVGFGGRRAHYGTAPYALAQLVVTYTDGTTETLGTDTTWKTSAGPIATSDLLMGETYDARKETTGWDTARFDPSGWASALVKPVPIAASPDAPPPPDPTTLLVASCAPAVRQVDVLHPISRVEKPKGAYVFDLGQNMVGWARLKVKGPAGSTVTLRFAEMLNKDGTVYTTNLRGARATDHYTLKGKGVEVYEPSFTFHGFRYVELTDYPGVPPLDAVTGIVAHSDTPETATFECSNPMVNQLQHNILWGMRGNYFDVPTDCPQRDERLGWMGDAQIFVRTGCYNMDISAFMTKWARDVEDAQSPAGGFSDVSPRLVDLSDGAPAWGDAGIIVPYTIWQCYGDTRIIEEHFEAMTKWIAYIESANPDLIWHNRANNNFGDWLAIGADTPRDVLATAYFAYDATLMARMAAAIGKTADADRYHQLFEGIKAAFIKKFVAPNGRIMGDTQTCYLVALHFHLLPDALRERAAQYLTEDIEKRDWHLSTGFVGVGYLTPTLTETGHLDVAYRLLNQDTFPSWGYSIKQGATTIWERWDGYTAEKGFQDPGMNSFNHYSLGSVGEWLYTSVGGVDLDPAQPGYKHLILHPRPGGGLTYARTTYASLYGKVVSDWQQGSDGFHYQITVPANTTATVFVPTTDLTRVQEGDKSAAQAEGVTFLRGEDGCAVYKVGSGTYRFFAPSP